MEKPTTSYGWTGWVGEITGWKFKDFEKITHVFDEPMETLTPLWIKQKTGKNVNTQPVGLGDTSMDLGVPENLPRHTALPKTQNGTWWGSGFRESGFGPLVISWSSVPSTYKSFRISFVLHGPLPANVSVSADTLDIHFTITNWSPPCGWSTHVLVIRFSFSHVLQLLPIRFTQTYETSDAFASL